MTKHNSSHTRLYRLLTGLKTRCYNKNNKDYKNYGARGIIICDEWLNDFLSFHDWAIQNGYDETAPKGSYTIDRLDVNGNYEPSNCRFINSFEQQGNKRNNHYLTYKGETHHIAEWARITGIKRKSLRERLARGWSVEKALETPIETSKIHDRTPVLLELNGESHTLSEWSILTGINRGTLASRLKSGWPIKEILKKPIRWSTYRKESNE